MKNNLENLIGTNIEVLDDNGNIIKNITIKNAREINDNIIVTDEDGEIYDEGQLNFEYRITPKGILASILLKYDIIQDLSHCDMLDDVIDEFMEGMIKSGYIVTK